jgi:hypothetical protein
MKRPSAIAGIVLWLAYMALLIHMAARETRIPPRPFDVEQHPKEETHP